MNYSRSIRFIDNKKKKSPKRNKSQNTIRADAGRWRLSNESTKGEEQKLEIEEFVSSRNRER